MEVQLTDKGRERLNLSGDFQKIAVSHERAFSMMRAGMVVKDDVFYDRYQKPEAKKNAPPEPKTRETATRKTKREKAVEVIDK